MPDVRVELIFQPISIRLKNPEEVDHFLAMCDLCSESLGKDSFSQFCRILRDRIKEAMGKRKYHEAKKR